MESPLVQTDYPEFVYHGTVTKYLSNFLNNLIDASYWKMNRDFGRGFYTTVDLDQAKEWAVHRASKSLNDEACVLQISCSVSMNFSGVRQHVFLGESQKWAEYILRHRMCDPEEMADPCKAEGLEHCDVVIGPMADNDTGAVVEEFKANSYGRDWFYENIRMSRDGNARQGLGLGNQIVYADDAFAREFLHLHSYWVYDNGRGWEHVEIGQR